MKTILAFPSAFLLTIALAALAFAAEIHDRPLPTNPDAIRVVTANIRQLLGAVADDTINDPNVWEKRKGITRDTLMAQHADIFCFQECRQEQLDYFMAAMPTFTYYALKVPYRTTEFRPTNPGNAILYNTTRFELTISDGFYLSGAPREIQSQYPESLSIRYANWAILRDRQTGHTIQVCNLHLDHLTGTDGGVLRGKQVAVALAAMNGLRTGAPQILTGDFNSAPVLTPDYAAYKQTTEDNGWTDTWVEMGNGPNSQTTSNPSFSGATTGNKIDYIFRRGKLRATRAEIITDYRSVDGIKRYPSDHYFVSADLEYDTSTSPIIETTAIVMPPTAEFKAPVGVAVDAPNTVFVADEDSHQIKKIIGIGTDEIRAVAFAGTGSAGFLDNANGAFASFMNPRALALQDGFWYVADHGNRVLRIVKNDETAATALYAGAPPTSYDEPFAPIDGNLGTARFAGPAAVAIAPDSTIYIADSNAHTIRKIAADGTVTTFAGQLGISGSSNGAGSAARFNEPLGLALDASGRNLYVADAGNHIIRKIDLASATVTTLAGVAGIPGWQNSSDATGATSRFDTPSALVVLNDTVYVADTANHTIRAVNDTTGATTLLAGIPQTQMPIIGITLDKVVKDGSPTEVYFSYPSGIAADAAGQNLFVADTGNGVVRHIDLATGAQTTSLFLGSGTKTTGPIPDDDPDDDEGRSIGPTRPSKGAGGGAVSPWCLLTFALLMLARGKTCASKKSPEQRCHVARGKLGSAKTLLSSSTSFRMTATKASLAGLPLAMGR